MARQRDQIRGEYVAMHHISITSWDDTSTEQPDYPTKEEVQREMFLDLTNEPGTIDAILEGLGIAWLTLDASKEDDTLKDRLGAILDTLDPIGQ